MSEAHHSVVWPYLNERPILWSKHLSIVFLLMLGNFEISPGTSSISQKIQKENFQKERGHQENWKSFSTETNSSQQSFDLFRMMLKLNQMVSFLA